MNESMTGPAPSSGRKRWLLIALGLSVVLNLIIGGYVVGRILYGPPSFGGPHFGLHKMTRDLSEEGRDLARDVMREHFRPLKGELSETRQTRRDIEELLSAETVDMVALESALDRLDTQNRVIHETIRAAIVDLIQRLPPEERRKLHFAKDRKGH